MPVQGGSLFLSLSLSLSLSLACAIRAEGVATIQQLGYAVRQGVAKHAYRALHRSNRREERKEMRMAC